MMYANFLEEYQLLTINADPYLGTNDWTPNPRLNGNLMKFEILIKTPTRQALTFQWAKFIERRTNLQVFSHQMRYYLVQVEVLCCFLFGRNHKSKSHF